jgi:Xaa-Pro aminopeptidase
MSHRSPGKLPKHKLIELEWPAFGEAERPPQPPTAEFAARIDAARGAMERRGLTHLAVYADREHFANLAYLTGFDPRFEEALLILSAGRDPLILVGNECQDYLKVSPPWRSGQLRSELFQPFSLLNQPRDSSRLVRDIFAGEGIGKDSRVGCVGWKYFSENEHPNAVRAIDLPAYLVDTLRELAEPTSVVNATDIFMHPGEGLRTFCSAAEIAYFEYANVAASEGMRRMLFALREGMSDHDLAVAAQLNGEPLGCHMTLMTGDNPYGGLSGPVGARVAVGRPLSANVCYWGSNSCRAGWVARSAAELPARAQDYVAQFVGPYFEAIASWLSLLRIGTPGDALDRVIRERLPFDRFGIFLNAGHLIHLDEWLSSPVYPGSDVPIHSGMALQIDVIPVSEPYFSTRVEDGVIIADSTLRGEIQNAYPACFSRIEKRREFMVNVLGMELAEEVLPLSNIPGLVPPFLLRPHEVLAIEQ